MTDKSIRVVRQRGANYQGMEYYQNFEGNSGVVAYASNGDSIMIQFKSGDIYRYTTESAGGEHIQAMKKLARAGKGLATYISRYVRDKYATKLSPQPF